MKTSEIAQVLENSSGWQLFCNQYETEKYRLLSRKDGISTSSDLGLFFDSELVVVTSIQVKSLCRSAFENQINLQDVFFFATAIMLSGFDYDDSNTEDAIYMLSETKIMSMGDLKGIMKML